jgi:hypothetical protein
VYPEPPRVTVIEASVVAVRLEVNAAPAPPPPTNVRTGFLVYPLPPSINTSPITCPELIVAAAVAPAPGSNVAMAAAPAPVVSPTPLTMVIIGALVYPLPISVTVIDVIVDPTLVAVAVACIPPDMFGALI